jgi:hypothetical protein
MKISVGMARPPRLLLAAAAGTAARKHQPCTQAGIGIFRFAAGQRVWYQRFHLQQPVNLAMAGTLALLCRPVRSARMRRRCPMMRVMGDLTLVIAKPQKRPAIVKEKS